MKGLASFSLLLVAQALLVAPAWTQQLLEGTPRPHEESSYHLVDLGLAYDQPSFNNAKLPNGTAHTQDMLVTHAGWQLSLIHI